MVLTVARPQNAPQRPQLIIARAAESGGAGRGQVAFVPERDALPRGSRPVARWLVAGCTSYSQQFQIRRDQQLGKQLRGAVVEQAVLERAVLEHAVADVSVEREQW